MTASNSNPVDLEKGINSGVAAAAEAKQELVVKDPALADAIAALLDIFFVVYLLFYIGFLVVIFWVSEHWWNPLPAVVVLSPIFVATLCLTPKMKGVYIKLYAMRSPGSDNDLNSKLLASEKM